MNLFHFGIVPGSKCLLKIMFAILAVYKTSFPNVEFWLFVAMISKFQRSPAVLFVKVKIIAES